MTPKRLDKTFDESAAGILKFYIPPAIAIQKHKGGTCGFSARGIGSGMYSFARNNMYVAARYLFQNLGGTRVVGSG